MYIPYHVIEFLLRSNSNVETSPVSEYEKEKKQVFFTNLGHVISVTLVDLSNTSGIALMLMNSLFTVPPQIL